MPTYDYRCLKCGKKFILVHSMADHGKKRAKCSKCGSLHVQRILGFFLVKTSKKS